MSKGLVIRRWRLLFITCIIWLLSVWGVVQAADGVAQASTSILAGKESTHMATSEPYVWKPVRIGGGGYVTGIVGHPLEKDLVYIRTDVGGAYRWDGISSMWIPILDGFGSDKTTYYNVESLNVDPANPNIVYAAVGRLRGGRKEILRSTDKGASWTETGWHGGEIFGNGEYRWTGERLAVDPNKGDIVYFGTREEGLWRTTNAAIRGGWTRIPTSAVPVGSGVTASREGTTKVGVTFVAFDKNGGTNADGATNIIYAGAWGDGVFYSTDAGVSWSRLNGSPQYPIQGKVAPNGTLYVTHEYSNFTQGGAVRCLRGGSCVDIQGFSSGGYSGVSVHPTDANTVVIAKHNRTTGNEVYRTTDGGLSWSKVNYSRNSSTPWWPTSHWFSRTSAILIDPIVPNRVWAPDWYGTWRTDDITADPSVWTNQENGHEEVVVHTLLSPAAGATALFSGVADVSGFRHTRLDEYPLPGNRLSGTQDVNSYAVCPTNANVVYRAGNTRNAQTGKIFRSGDNGQTWSTFDPAIDSVLPKSSRGGRIVVSSSDCNNVVWLPVADSPYTSMDGGKSWRPSAGISSKNIVSNEWLAPLQPLAANQTTDNNSMYLYEPGMGFYRSSDGGASFKAILRNGLPFNNARTWMVKPVPNQSGGVWVSLLDNGLYTSTDYGTTFRKVESVVSAQAMSFGKSSNNQPAAVYLIGRLVGDTQAENRIYRSDDMGNTWIRINDDNHKFGLVNTIEGDGQVFGRVYLGSSGRGVTYGEPIE